MMIVNCSIQFPHQLGYPDSDIQSTKTIRRSHYSKEIMVKLLIVEDNALVRDRLVKTMAQIGGIEVIGQAEDALGAIQFLRKSHPDVVTLDIHIHSGSGIDVLKNLRKKRNKPLVIIFTNYPYPQYRKKCMELGADFFFDKANDFATLRNTLKSLSRQMVNGIPSGNKKPQVER